MTRQPRIGQRLAAARLRRRLSQASVARSAGIAPSYLSRIETGKVQPTFRTMARVARAMGLQFEELDAFEPGAHRYGTTCPISREGTCLLDLIRTYSASARSRNEEFYTPQQIRVLRRVAAWIRDAPPNRLQALEILFDDLAGAHRRSSDH